MSSMNSTATRLPATERRAAILAAAIDVALTEGLAMLTLRKVGEQAGVASGLVAHYVDGMDALVAEVFTAISAEERIEVTEKMVRAEAGLPRLVALVRTLTDGSRDGVTRVWVQAWAAAPANEVLATAVRAEMDAWQELVERPLQEAAVADRGPVARLLLGMIDGVNAHALAGWRDRTEHGPLLLAALEAMLGIERGRLSGA